MIKLTTINSFNNNKNDNNNNWFLIFALLLCELSRRCFFGNNEFVDPKLGWASKRGLIFTKLKVKPELTRKVHIILQNPYKIFVFCKIQLFCISSQMIFHLQFIAKHPKAYLNIKTS